MNKDIKYKNIDVLLSLWGVSTHARLHHLYLQKRSKEKLDQNYKRMLYVFFFFFLNFESNPQRL